MDKKMFCFQCEQTVGCAGCTGNAGVCGKKAKLKKDWMPLLTKQHPILHLNFISPFYSPQALSNSLRNLPAIVLAC